LENTAVTEILREFLLSKYFAQRKEKRAIVQQLMQTIYDRIGKSIKLEQNMDFIKVKGNKVVLKGEDSDESMMESAGNYPEEEDKNINMQIQLFNKSLKEEKMIERLETYMNEGSINLIENDKLFEYLKKKDYLILFISIIGKPHINHSSITVIYRIIYIFLVDY